MNEPEEMERFAATSPGDRILLLSHCMRPSATCPGKFSKRGLVCPEDCREDCAVGRLSRAAISLGYKGVCVAAGGAMAVRFVVEHDPKAIVAVACARELGEGVDAVGALARDHQKETPAIVVVPLKRDGCVDTEVDEGMALDAISAGCEAPVVS